MKTQFSDFLKQNYKKLLFALVFLPLSVWLNYMVFVTFQKKGEAAEVSREDTLVFGTHTILAPFAFSGGEEGKEHAPNALKAQGGKYASGFDPLVAKKIADLMGKKLVIKHYGFPALLDTPQTGTTDFVMGGMNSSPERLQVMDAVNYYSPPVGFLLRKDDARFKDYQNGQTVPYDVFKQIALDAKNQNKPLKYTTITRSLFDLKDKEPTQKLEGLKIEGGNPRESAAECSDLVQNKAADMCVFEYPAAKSLADRKPDALKVVKLEGFAVEPVSLFLQKERPDGLKEKLQLAVNQITEQDREEFFKKASEDEAKMAELTQSAPKEKAKNVFVETTVQVFKILPSYFKPLVISLTLAVDGLLLGFFLSLFLLVLKLFGASKNSSNKCVKYLKKGLFTTVDALNNALKSVPMIIQVLLLSKFLVHNFDFFKHNAYLGSFYTGLMLLVVNAGANLSSLMFRNIQYLDKGQMEAASALGMNQKQVFQHIVFEQTFKRTVPSIWEQLIINLKDTAVFGLINVANLVLKAQEDTAISFSITVPFLAITLIYLVLVNVVYVLNRKNNKLN
ncbi:transporter substrate-binding domain-containing protein [Candidatus Phytoplasma pruni]|uniref:Transporter substrate-binding domain-containing protein n=1 Tax=Candidatus Phytoplasma pruni TaxID=479893 RepID=A0A851HC55_9MOLU|nr:transporter substrate-binding domain-containing protein [Candidatus Phytoplasma pruni]NWN45578.1 transporter substrate-binding domain-containing protein [Candidatus Phytoplasma pruni]